MASYNNIPVGQASPIYTSGLIAKFDEMAEIKVNNFFRSFFPDLPCPERFPVIEVRRGTEKVAVDVVRGTQGIRTSITKSTQKAFDPFYYKLWFDATELQPYFRVFGSQSWAANDMAELINGVALQNKANKDMIDRGIELHCANVLLNGTCTSLRDGSIVDFKRQAGSMVALGTVGQNPTWDTAGTNPFTDIKAGGDWLKQKGKYGGHSINVIFGDKAWAAFRNNDTTHKRLSEFNNRRDSLEKAQLESIGAIYQGTFDTDGYIMHAWIYNDVYDDPATGVSTYYMPSKQVIIMPPNPGFKTLYGAIPQVVAPGANTSSLVAQPYVMKRFINEEEGYDRSYIESSPLPVPIQVDRIYTLTVLA